MRLELVKREVVRLVNDQREVFIVQVLSLNLSATAICRHRNFQMLSLGILTLASIGLYSL